MTNEPEPPQDAQDAGAPSRPAEPSAEELLQRQLEELQGRLRTVSKAYTDLQKEMGSFRERNERDAKSRAERQAMELVQSFFEPVMNLRRALGVEVADVATLRDGVQMVLQQFNEVLTRLGLEEVPGVGSDFDPRWHEALAQQPVSDAGQDGKILVVHATGYRVGTKLLQPAHVVIGRYTPEGEA